MRILFSTAVAIAVAFAIVRGADARVRGRSTDENAKRRRRLQLDDCMDAFKLSDALEIPGGSSRARPVLAGPGCGTDRKNPNLNFGMPAPSPGIPVPTELPTILQISVTQPPTKAPTDVPTRSPTDPPSKLPSNGIPLDRPVQAPPPINTEGVETCGYTSNWDYAPGTDRHPIVPCTKHSDCAGFFDKDVVFDEYVPCCLYWRCICGSTFFETTSQAQHCALFECTTDVECPGGSCIQGVCDFSNVV